MNTAASSTGVAKGGGDVIEFQEFKSGCGLPQQHNDLESALDHKQDDSEMGIHDDIDGEQKLKQNHKSMRRVVSIQDQTSRLPMKKLLVVFAALALSAFLSFLDATSVSPALATIAGDFGAGSQISWVGTSFLIANTSAQILYGRLSDIFGRKSVLVTAIVIFGIGNLLCGFSQTMVMLIVCRGISGVGSGGINSMTMIILSDIVSLRKRGKYQGYIGSAALAGNAAGPLLGSILTERATWRWVFWYSVPISAVIAISILIFLPIKPVTGTWHTKVKKIDFGGSLLSLGGIILILVPVSGGGSTYPWNSPMVISMLVVGIILWILFILFEWKLARLPLMPLHLFTIPSVSFILFQTLLVGVVYYGNIYYLPIYFQIVLQKSIIESGLLLLPLVVTQSLASIATGQLISRTGKYNPSIRVGFVFWVVGLGVQTTFSKDSSLATIICILLIEGIGMGSTFQLSNTMSLFFC